MFSGEPTVTEVDFQLFGIYFYPPLDHGTTTQNCSLGCPLCHLLGRISFHSHQSFGWPVPHSPTPTSFEHLQVWLPWQYQNFIVFHFTELIPFYVNSHLSLIQSLPIQFPLWWPHILIYIIGTPPSCMACGPCSSSMIRYSSNPYSPQFSSTWLNLLLILSNFSCSALNYLIGFATVAPVGLSFVWGVLCSKSTQNPSIISLSATLVSV